MGLYALLRTRVARRILGMFVLSALLPIAAVGVLSYVQVSRQLAEQSRGRLWQTSKSAGLAIFDRLQFIESELKLIALTITQARPITGYDLREDSSLSATPRFRAASVQRAADEVPLFGALTDVPRLTVDERDHLRSGRSVLWTAAERILIGRAVDPADPRRGVLWAEVDPVYLWRAADDDVALGTDAEMCVFGGSGAPLYCTFADTAPLLDALRAALAVSDAGNLEWSAAGGEYLSGYWTLFLKFNFVEPQWTVVLTEPASLVVAPLAQFRRTFPLVALLTILVVALLSHVQIRRNLDPLAKLQEATQRVGVRDFDNPVTITSGDEFEVLALSFNRMATRLKRQFEESEELNAVLAQTSEQLRENEARLRTILESAADAIVTMDERGAIESFNRTAERTFGYGRAEVVGRSFAVLMIGWDDRSVVDEITRQVGGAREVVGRRKDGTTLPLELVLRQAVVGDKRLYTGFLRDLSERRKAEEERSVLQEQLAQAQKLETIGTLAGGVAHDFNNLLTPIHGYVDLVLADLPTDSPMRADLMEIKRAATRAQDLVRQILLFSRHEEPQRRITSIAPPVADALKLLRATLPVTIDVQQHIDEASPAVLADASRIHQVVMNLGTNAYHAMREDGGVLDVRLEPVHVDEQLVRNHPRLQEGLYVRLTVRDTGHGMDRRTTERIFEPFFTTKNAGEGTGLGLSVVHGIVVSHQGEIAVTSTPGTGTTFVVYLPAAEQVAPDDAAVPSAPPRGSERVLLVDDDPQVGDVGKRMLQRLGYRVTLVTESEVALAAFRATPEDFDIVISDQTMPHMTGAQLGKELRRIRSELPLILTTGYSEQGLREQLNGLECAFVGKPFEIGELAGAVRRVLDGGQGQPTGMSGT